MNLYPDTFPAAFPAAWAVAFGEDPFGYWQAFDINGVRQVMRWIPPGRFDMGSPANEPERGNDETLHEVTLTQGYWLADTACTQALWRAVTGDNPARFSEDEAHPVEQVTWEDVQGFIEQANQRLPQGPALRLPTEAEWESACRAGTTTPFSMGDQVSTDQANYDGRLPYLGGAKGEYRNKTVPALYFDPNPWGLYQMHGNVWEWCQDWEAAYPTRSVTDPAGPDQGRYRVLRGGSWIDSARRLRSARRDGYDPGYRLDNIGFRLAAGHAPGTGR